MLFDFRTDSTRVNDTGEAMNYAADYACWVVARDMLAKARKDADRLANTVPASGEGQVPLVRCWAESRLAEHTVLILTGELAMAEKATASYPAHIKCLAEDRGWCPIPADLSGN